MQFIDVGAGLPASPNVHETARKTASGARVAYVDRDPVVVSHGRALLATDDRVAMVAGDIRDPAAVLADPGPSAVIDLGQPVCVLRTAVLHFIEPAEADSAVAAFRQLPGTRQLPGHLRRHVHRHRPGTGPRPASCLRPRRPGHRPHGSRDRGLVCRDVPGPARAERGLGVADASTAAAAQLQAACQEKDTT